MFDALALHGALHDATVHAIHHFWEERRCTFQVSTVHHGKRLLVFTEVTGLHVTADQPWGPSASILGVSEVGPGQFDIEMQSGDMLRVHAAGWTFDAVAG